MEDYKYKIFGNTRYIKTKIDLNSNENARKVIESKFNDPNRYLEVDNKIIIGKGSSSMGSERFKFIKLTTSPYKAKQDKKFNLQKTQTTMMKNSVHKGGTTTVVVNDKQLNEIYENCQEKISKSQVNDFFNHLDIKNKNDLSKILYSQERILNLHDVTEKKQKKIIDYIENKLKRKEKELLVNTIYSFRTKKEVYETIDKNIPFERKYGNNSWVMALRRPDVFTGARYGYINLRDAKNPYWQLIKEKSNEEVVTIKHPNCSQIDFNKKDYMMKTLSSMGLKMESTMSNLNTNISVKIF
jgi:hypothetical protein